ncbi:Uncharacterised protein family (UPF0182) [uncultured Eubacterium sp.]|uniref:UPF0182 family membrane protein n=1 Tax=Brotomerdimonas butyrica TaxID=2981721 RepID=UPI0008232BA5|nr:UPF0182 family protein [Brotomerdimonas butyrica]MCU6755632.1 UPF0182 family protein [Brotomerdimonas butyrica]SCH40823.1 Uncharacterised protein family (UPF0182) [uncultured Eubacterium sp.]
MTKEKKKRTGLRVIIAIVIILGLFLSLIGFITDFMWFRELGYVSVFFTKLFTQIKIGVPTFVVVTFLAYIYLKFLKRGYFIKVSSDEPVNHGRLNLISWGLAAAYGAITTFFTVTKLWFDFLQFINSTSFGKKDPLFDMDISFYAFKLDFIEEVNQIVLVLLIAFAVLTVIYYSILLTVRTPKIFEEKAQTVDEEEEQSQAQGGAGNGFDNLNGMFGKFTEAFTGKAGGGFKRPSRPRKSFDNQNLKMLVSIAEKQLIIVGVLFFLMVGVNFFLKQYDLLFGSTGAVHGAGFTDVNITLWMYRIIMVLAVFAAVGFAVGISRRHIKPAVVAPIIMIIIGVAGTGAALVVQNLVVTPDEINKESRYLERNIEYTQTAYGLNDVNKKEFAASNDLTGEDISNNDETISNIRINDYEPAKTFYNQTQSIKQYYSFNDVNVDRYNINGEYTQTFLSAREIDENSINDTWLNKHLKYTHGYGITLSRVDKITASGQPDMLIGGIPPVSDVDEIKITRPEIYYGELTNNYVLTNTSEEEFDYPDGNENKYTTYEGDAGIKLNPLNRFMFAVKERSLKLLVSGNVKSSSKILINRNIKERVKQIMPYLEYDKSPYMVTVDGKLYWIIDAYTYTNRYPYSEPFSDTSDTNYIRNSVKVVIDAYNGTTDYYIVDDTDPIAQNFKKIYPDLFKDIKDMPEGIKAHIRYPSTLLNIQAQVYQRYHMNDVKVFYQNEDLWQISSEIYGTEEQTMSPNYYIMKLPGEDSAEFVNSIPLTPKDKKNLMGLFVARNDGGNYGELILYQMPKSQTVYGPMQIEAQIDQNTEISKEFSLWNSSGSKYSRGNMFVVPIEDSLLYIEPVYLEATNSSIPEVKRVIVVYGDNIAYEATLAEALNSMFGEGSAYEREDSGNTDTTSGGNGDELSQTEIIKRAQDAFDNAQNAQKNGDWAKYGEYLNELDKYLNMLSK